MRNGIERYIELRLPIGHITGEEGAFGTSDLVLMDIPQKTLSVVDAKFGGSPVEAEDSRQGLGYALSAFDLFSMVHEIDTVKFIIVQPPLKRIREWSMSDAELEARRDDFRPAKEVKAGEKQCKWCSKKTDCPALAAFVKESVACDFEDLTGKSGESIQGIAHADLASSYAAVDLVELWAKAVRKKAFEHLSNGLPLPGFKLVQGRAGNRKWSDSDDAEQLLKSMRLKTEQIYDLKVISPTSAEKLRKAGDIGPRQWTKVEGLITRDEGKLQIASENDKREAVEVDAFTPV